MSKSNTKSMPSVPDAVHAAGPAAVKGSPNFEQLYRVYWKDLCGHLRRMFGAGPPEPEDAVQAAFIRYAALEEPQKVRNPRAFLLVTARNIILDQKRRSGRHMAYAKAVLAENSGPQLDDISPERVLLEKERFEAIDEAFRKLPEKQQVILTLRRQHGYTYQQIANETGWSYGDVYRQMDKALASLSQALKR
ncbi:RNA polymerase sigma factor [Hyphomonas jannaschiana]|uniref:RNA polymerase sigma factor n=1 Tax=Hyphomonas jannaschiana TaxID=86 RepID=UPI0035C6AF3C